MRHPLPIALAALAALTFAACDDEPGAADPEPGADMAPDPEPEPSGDMAPDPEPEPTPDMGPGADAAPQPEQCVFPDVERGAGLIETTRGLVQGHAGDDVWVWQGIPFAAPPVGDLRYKAPEPHACWDDVFEADTFGPVCPQISVNQLGQVSTRGEEDCLTLNIWSPVAEADGTARPVLFFIHGGANIVGSASEEIAAGRPTYDGTSLATRGDAVVVTIQYRLGALGFVSLPELDAESPTGTSGNQGLQDQLAALRWVHENIAAFGGDPERVMVFGESAGGLNTCMMLATPLSDGLMHSALIQSGACNAAPKVSAQASAGQAAELLGCAGDDRLACLRALDPLDIVEQASGSVGIGASPDQGGLGLSWGPLVDGYVLPTAPLQRFAAGEHTSVPVVVGSNADEMASRTLNRVTVESLEDYERAVQVTFGVLGADAVDRILETYAIEDYESPDDAFIQVTSDAFFTCTARTIARTLAVGQDDPVYRYFFRRRFVTAMGEGRAQHGIELLYVFRTLEDIPFYTPAPGEIAVADQMMDAWLGLATDGDPSGGAAGEWPPYAIESETSLVFDDPAVTEDGVRGAKCDMWEELVAGLM